MEHNNDSIAEEVEDHSNNSNSSCESDIVMIPKSYSEGISLNREGPKSSIAYRTTCNTDTGKSYVCSVSFIPKFVPKRFITYLTIEEKWMKSPTVYNRTCCYSDGVKSYNTSASFTPKPVTEPFVSNLSVDEDATYYEVIEFERKIVAKNFSEAINNFSRDKTYSYCSKFIYDPNYTRRNYITGVEIIPVQKMAVTAPQSKLPPSAEILHNDAVEDNCYSEQNLMNGNCDNLRLVNGVCN